MYDASELLDYLDERKVPYQVKHHPATTSAQRTAAAEHVSGKHVAKPVVVRTPAQRLLLAVVPAHLRVDLDKLWSLAKVGPLSIATEAEFAESFPDSQPGAMPPFARLHNVEVFVDDDLAVAPEVTFAACSYEHTVTVSGKDFFKLAEARVGDISMD